MFGSNRGLVIHQALFACPQKDLLCGRIGLHFGFGSNWGLVKYQVPFAFLRETLHGRHAELWKRGANISLGSDSANWSNVFDLFRQANLALLTAREAHQDRNYLQAEDALEMATLGGARACGMEDRIGSLEVGKRADLVIHTLRRTELLPVTDLLRNLIYSSGSKSVDSVIIDGKVILDHGEFQHFDEQALLAQVNAGSKAMLKRMGHEVEKNQRPTPGSMRQ